VPNYPGTGRKDVEEALKDEIRRHPALEAAYEVLDEKSDWLCN